MKFSAISTFNLCLVFGCRILWPKNDVILNSVVWCAMFWNQIVHDTHKVKDGKLKPFVLMSKPKYPENK